MFHVFVRGDIMSLARGSPGTCAVWWFWSASHKGNFNGAQNLEKYEAIEY